ncbi:Mo-dependent nitrogenase C-terminal domain-containing protein [Leptothoe sp. PORK10 BA2]|uniref:Mo-dependent nitrogenase C-terminal domain-containing protein n=1 Tax=Leptothoe sp. PORK10 BA2 TaxID=3110254 RepID=UPI002B207E3F|nr:Mo-dependent nitrogenase C-terminal domain-containing protein [Leptothoe sp. PORK10 BA2]MEA5462879.1 Mo-dependent nitrogenase C-terminal domain-containing protein [Leptothoe sp. PORK10 BA2]
MASTSDKSLYTEEQIKGWLRGLLAIAWADGEFDQQEKDLIHTMMEVEFAPKLDFQTFEPIKPAELAAIFTPNPIAAENFLRMGVMVAIADGLYSAAEDKVLMEFCQALNLDTAVLQALQSTLYNLHEVQEEVQPGTSTAEESSPTAAASPLTPPSAKAAGPDPLKPVREWLDQLHVDDPRLARFVCKMIPSQCPFERDVTLFGKKVVHIPPMCKLNPLYEQMVGLRFRALTHLADDLGEDITAYL